MSALPCNWSVMLSCSQAELAKAIAANVKRLQAHQTQGSLFGGTPT